MRDSHRIAVVGGGPAGAFAASLLAGAGHDVTLFDEKLAWEKPCGGALTAKAVSRYPFLRENGQPKKIIREAELAGPSGAKVRLRLREPIYIYSRLTLNDLLLDRARQAGCRMVRKRITAVERQAASAGWLLSGTGEEHRADYLILAAGARNPFRGFQLPGRREDTGMTLGYFLPGTQDHLEVQFLRGYEGYLWVFPRHDHLSVGIYGRLLDEPSSRMKERLHHYLEQRGLAWEGAPFFSHPLPSLTRASWRKICVAGEGWAAVGDAAGLVDPVTGEGLFYALRSAELLVDCYQKNCLDQYRQRLRAGFAHDLELGALLSRRFYTGTFLGAPVTTRMIQFASRSHVFSNLLQDLFAGSQGYSGLKRRLKENLVTSLREFLGSFVWGRPGQTGAPTIRT